MWTDEMTQIIQDQFVAVAVSAHVAMNRKDADGEFLRGTGIELAGAGGNLECLTAGGIRLGSFYAAGGTEHNRRDLEQILKAWKALPAGETAPGAVQVPEQGEPAENITHIAPPPNALILRTYHRILTREPDGTVREARAGDYPQTFDLTGNEAWIANYGEKWEAQPDFMWIKEDEWKSLVRPNPTVGDSYPLLEAVADRMTRAHLIMGMAYGECGICGKSEVRSRSLHLTVATANDDTIELRLEGRAALGADYETADKRDRKGAKEGESVQGFEPEVLGYLTFDRRSGTFTRFDVVALGDAYGTPWGDHFFYYRSGKYPIGISFELADGSRAAERIPPRAAVVYDTPNPEYLATGK